MRSTSLSVALAAEPVAADATLSIVPQHQFAKDACILMVDDEPLNISVVESYLRLDGYENIFSTYEAPQALPLVRKHRPDLVLLDIHMPGMSGLEILSAIRDDKQLANTPVVILTANTSDEIKLQALEGGASDLLSKPVHQGELLARLRNVLATKSYQDHLYRYSEELEEAVRVRTGELEASRMEVIHCLARAAEFRDDVTGQHIIRVGRYARLIAEELGFSEEELDLLEPAAQLHDVGKIGIRDDVLLKPGTLTPEEYEAVQKHCTVGKKIVECLPAGEARVLRAHTELGARIVDVGGSPILDMAKRIALTHHERWDGTGYPLGLAGTDIPLEGRITCVADVFDALSSKRPYKPPFPLEKCFQILEEGRGSQFDPEVLDAFFARRRDIVEVQMEFADV